ncbi:MAG: Ldh family oxidoreductase [Bacteroidetes bacterium]|nr:Ldh family oxidoreductase [Bacteroidota bacterium]
MKKYSHAQLRSFTEQVFVKLGMPANQAEIASSVLTEADLRGIDSHGVARLSGYVRLRDANRANFAPSLKILHETPSTASLDADLGLGLFTAQEAMKLAMQKARHVGTGWVAVQNSNHFGIAAAHAMLALEEDMIGFAMTNASPLVAPSGSKERMLGTNPICVAIPAGKEKPFVLDMATSAAANGKLEIAQRLGKSLPDNWVQTREGGSSNDAFELKNGGSLLPLGGHKGYGLAAMVDILSAVLPGANYGPWVPPFVAFLNPLENLPGKGIGHFVGAMRVDAFRPKEEFLAHMDNWIQRFKASERLNPEEPVLIPGEPELEAKQERLAKGIMLNAEVENDLLALAARFELSL